MPEMEAPVAPVKQAARVVSAEKTAATAAPAATAAMAQRAAQVVAVALPALARRFPDPLPAGAIDAAGAVMTYGDVVGWTEPVDPRAAALDAGAQRSHAELLAPSPSPGRVLLAAPPRTDLAAFLLDVLAVLAGDGSVVITSPATTAELDVDPPRRARLVASERVTAGAVADQG